jgi:hypothetical protein
MNNFNDLMTIFQNVFLEYITILKSVKKIQQSPQIQQTQYDFLSIHENDLKSFYIKMNIFLNKLKLIENNQILVQGFFDKNYDELTKIKFFLIKLQNKKSRSLHDIIFIKIFKMNNHVPLGITRIFEEFIKGITYFSNELEHIHKIPIYHRAASCGNSSKDFIKKYLRCYETNAPEIIEHKKNHIFKCYLERMIYDDMFIHSSMYYPTGNGIITTTSIQQNKGHSFQLNERARNFNSCFLGIKMNIKIIYEDNFPTILYIYYRNQNDEIIKTEKFEKILYFDIYKNGCYTKNIFYTRYDENGIYEDTKWFSGHPDDDEYL